MFATLLGPLPAPPGADDATARLRIVLEAQAAAGLEALTDGLPAADPGPGAVERWRAAAVLTERAVKAVLRGPWSGAVDARLEGAARRRAVTDRAEALHDTVLALAEAGCPLVEIREHAADRIGADDRARRDFREAHLHVTRDVESTHLSLSIVGGSAWEAGAATILDPPYRSLAVDLVAGPENWRLVAASPGDRGIIVGVVEVGEGTVEGPELPVWAAHYAASTRGRGLARVGIGTSGDLAALPWPVAVVKLAVLAEAARIAGLPGGDLADALDPRAVSKRSAALGRAARRRPRP